VDELIEHIIANREPSARSGNALALGHIYAQLGGMAAGLHLKKILGVLNSLSSDPHPTVHFWALESISRLSNSAGLNFAPYVTSTLGLLARLYITEHHNDEVGPVMFSNLEVDLPTAAVLARCVDSVINVLGPDLQDAVKARDLIMALIGQFETEKMELVLIESLKCQEHLSLYAPGHINFSEYVTRLQVDLDSDFSSIRSTAVDGLHNLMRRDADGVVSAAQPGLEDRLWLVLDKAPENDGVKNIMRNWLHQTGLSHTALWVQRCNVVLTKITMKAPTKPPLQTTTKPAVATDLQDEEIAGFATASGVPVEDDGTAGSSSQELLRWQTRSFAMDLLAQLLTMGARDAAVHDGSRAEAALQGKVADVIRIAFSASTTGVIALRIRGLQIINQLLKVYLTTT
jgi:HEAT repeat-containing protein 5